MAALKSSIAVEALSALAHEGRLSIFRLLVRAGTDGIAAGEIARKLDILPNTLSASLTVLTHAGLIISRREGRSIIYSADYNQLRPQHRWRFRRILRFGRQHRWPNAAQ